MVDPREVDRLKGATVAGNAADPVHMLSIEDLDGERTCRDPLVDAPPALAGRAVPFCGASAGAKVASFPQDVTCEECLRRIRQALNHAPGARPPPTRIDISLGTGPGELPLAPIRSDLDTFRAMLERAVSPITRTRRPVTAR